MRRPPHDARFEGIALEHVTKSFEGRAVVRDVTLRLGPGERVALIGPSGCGKSTLLRLVLGLVTPDGGTVRFGGVTPSPANAALRRRIGCVLQDGGLFPHLTAAENVTLVARLGGGERLDERVRDLADLAKLPVRLLGRYPGDLSGGERQRVGLMRALMLDPEVLLLDEPLGALDPVVRAQLQVDLCDAFRALGKAVLLVTHDMAEAAYLADSIAVMARGSIVQRGAMRELIEEPADPFVTEFVRAQRTLQEALR